MFEFNPGQRRADEILCQRQRHTCLVGGARSGKTLLLCSAILIRASRAPGSRHLIARQHGNAARSSISLDTLPNTIRLRFPDLSLIEHRQDGYFSLPNGSEIWVGGLDEQDRVDKILGREYCTIFFNECSQILYSTVTTVLTRLAQVAKDERRKKVSQRAYYDLNPVGKGHWTNTLFGDKRDPIKREPLPDPENYVREFLNPLQNKKNLTPEYIQSLENLPERQRKRFYEGVYVDEVEGALWSYEGIERARVEELPVEQRRRVVVAVDPSGAASMEDNTRDEIGIVVAALGTDGHGYVLADRSLRDAPAAWARAVVQAYRDFGADSIVVEQNFGGEMVRSTIRAVDDKVGVKLVTASRAKVLRAEPVAALYGDPPEFKNTKVHHVGRLPVLEDQMVAFSTAGYRGEGSPDHVDALVFAITELMLSTNAEAWISYFGDLAEQAKAQGTEKKPDRPVPEPEPSVPENADNSVVEAYRRVTNLELAKTEKCAWCDEPLGGSVANDGEDRYHLDCYNTMLARGKKTDASHLADRGRQQCP